MCITFTQEKDHATDKVKNSKSKKGKYTKNRRPFSLLSVGNRDNEDYVLERSGPKGLPETRKP